MKLRNSFQARISVFLALLLLLVIGAVYFAVKAVTISVSRDQAQEQLKTGTRVFERFMDLRWNRIQYGLDWLTNDSGFREATINGSPSLIERVLAEFESSLKGSELFVLDLDGRLITSTLKALPAGQVFPYAEALKRARRTSQTMVIGILAGRPYMMVQSAVLAPLPVVRVVSGMPMGEAFAHELSSLSNLQVSFLTVKQGESGILKGTQPDFMSASIIKFVDEHTPSSMIHFSEIHGKRFLGQLLQLANTADPGNGQVLAVLQSPLDESIQAFNSLDRKFLLILGAALLASLLGALWLARAVSRPVSLLAEAAQRIGRGHYETPVELKRKDELGFLASAINAMQSGIAAREQQLVHNTLHDSVTGLPNRTLVM